MALLSIMRTMVLYFASWLTWHSPHLSGLELARLADLPPDVLQEAQRVSERLSALQAREEGSSDGHKTSVRRKALLRVFPHPPHCLCTQS